MLQLMLLRHAKSSWTAAGLADAARPLTGRGKAAARAMGREIAARGLKPDLVLCSPARRARDTWKIAAAQLKSSPRVLVEDAIYDFGNGGRVLSAIFAGAGPVKSVLVVGHNPSLERLAARLSVSGDARLRARIERKYPTASLAVIHFTADDWGKIADQGGELRHFIRPKDLVDES